MAITAVANMTGSENNLVLERNDIDNFEFVFSEPEFSKINEYDTIFFSDADYITEPGQPQLPVKNIFIFVPYDSEIDIEVVGYQEEILDGNYNLFPVQNPIPLGMPAEPDFFIGQDPEIYSSENPFPEEIIKLGEKFSVRGNTLLPVSIFPVQYIPTEEKLIFYKKIRLQIKYNFNDNAKPAGAFDLSKFKSEYFNSQIKSLIANTGQFDYYAEYSDEISPGSLDYPDSPGALGSLSPSPSYCSGLSSWNETELKYIIITNESFENDFQLLADWKTAKGIPAKVISIQDINTSVLNCIGDGITNDTQSKIRNFIKDVYDEWQIEWVLLGGDTNVVAHRMGYGLNCGIGGDDYIPTDFYYSDLNGTWNADGDSIYGEITDSVDLSPEVYVSRAPVDTVSEVQNFVSKILNYEKNPAIDYQLKTLFLGEQLDASTNGGDCKDAVDSYVPATHDPIVKRYEKDSNISVAITTDELNANPHLVNHAGHGGTNYFGVNGNFLNSNADALTNANYFILYSISCYSNNFESDSLSEHFMNNNKGSTAYIGNSRYGWFISGQPGNGPSDKYDQQFFNSLFSDDFYKIGQTHTDAKLTYASSSGSDGVYRCLQYAINLLGDPEMPVWTALPKNFTIDKVTSIYTGINNITVHVENSTGDAVENAIVCLSKGSDVYNHSLTDSYGNITFTISPKTKGVINVTVTKHNFLPLENNITVLNGFPKYSDNSTNSTIAGSLIEHRLKWQDDYNLSGYIFSFDNCTNNFVNDSFVSFLGTENWSNVTKYANETHDCNIRWKVYANDSNGNWNESGIFSYLVNIIEYPKADFGTNPIDNANLSNQTITFDLKCSDDTAVDELQLWGNWTGSWAMNQTNNSPINDSWWNVTVSGIADGNYKWGVYCNDTSGNDDWTINRTFIIDIIAPVLDLELSSSSITKGSSITATCNATDANGIKNITITSDDGTTICSSNSSGCSETYTPSASGIKIITCSAYDPALNYNSSSENLTVTTTTGNGGGGGGGGADTPTVYNIGTDLIKGTVEKTLRKNEAVKFNFKNLQHTIKAHSLFSDSIKLEISSNTFYVTIGVNESTKVDVDENGLNDMLITLLSISISKANLKFELIEEFQPQTSGEDNNITEEVATTACGNGICERDAGENCENCVDCACRAGEKCIEGECVKQTHKKDYFWLIALGVLLAITIIIIFKKRSRGKKANI